MGSGLRLEFIPMKIGAGVTVSEFFTISSNKRCQNAQRGVKRNEKLY
jgi:hypothetical protein